MAPLSRRSFLAGLIAMPAIAVLAAKKPTPHFREVWKPHPKQIEFLNDPRPRVLYMGDGSTWTYPQAQWRRIHG